MRTIPRYNDETGTFQIVKVTKEAVIDEKGETVEEPEFEVIHDFGERADGTASGSAHEKACAAFDYFRRTGEIPLTTKKPVL